MLGLKFPRKGKRSHWLGGKILKPNFF
jgi:hypothetical protein